MSDNPLSPSTEDALFEQQMGAKAVRKLRAQSRGSGDVWFGLGMTGLIGWSLPLNIIGELSRTLALAVRLFGSMMSGVMIVAILHTITPFIFPIFMTALGLLTGMVQAYIFTILAGVYIAAATLTPKSRLKSAPEPAPAKI
ncbi:MAG: F0F1 ATP synthase subunit A [Granulicella sp.]